MDGERPDQLAEFFYRIEKRIRGIFADAVRTGRASIEMVVRDTAGFDRSAGIGSPPPEMHEIRVTPLNSRSAILSVYTYQCEEVHFVVGSNELWWDEWSSNPEDLLGAIRDVAMAVRDGGYSEMVVKRRKHSDGIEATFDSGVDGAKPKIVKSNWLSSERGAVHVEYEPY